MRIFGRQIFGMVLLVVFAAGVGDAQIRRVIRRPAGGANLPYQVGDGHGETWVVYQAISIQMQGNMPLYQQAGFVQVNGNQPSQVGQPVARLDDKTGELVFENIQAGDWRWFGGCFSIRMRDMCV